MDFPKDFNIVLINIDGFRRDKIELCSTLNELKEQSYYFSNICTVAPYTFASLHSVFSGTYPSKNGVNSYYNSLKFKKNEFKTITELLKKRGYYTSCDVISKLVIPNIGFDDWQDQKIFDLWKQYILILCNYFICHTQYYNSLMTYVKTNNLLCEEIDDYMKKIENNINFYQSKLQKIYHKYTKKRLVPLNDFKQKKKNIVLSVINGLKNTTDIESIKLPPNFKKYTYDNTVCKSEIIINGEITIHPKNILPEVVNGFTLIEEMETTEHDKRKVLKDIIDNNFYTRVRVSMK